MVFPDSPCEVSLLTTLIINFHMNTTFTWHLNTWLQETGLNHTKTSFLNEYFWQPYCWGGITWHLINLGEALQVLTYQHIWCVCQPLQLKVSKIESFALLLWSTVCARNVNDDVICWEVSPPTSKIANISGYTVCLGMQHRASAWFHGWKV